MGSSQSVRESHFQREAAQPGQPGGPGQPGRAEDADPADQHISISNKMVERLVEDATLAGRAAGAGVAAGGAPRGHYKEKMITVEDLNATAARIELRTGNMVSVAPVCAHCKQGVIECYARADRPGAHRLDCADAVGERAGDAHRAFASCVKAAAAQRLRARTQRDAREHARRERHVAHAREHALRDLAPQQPQPQPQDAPA
ncbi:hypothetical protein RR46_11265 [Papilio xuthus]|uniref:Uncharacterized protein n=1 Tax=Papilio xuthus TaxID=66420 RepID=A0A194PZH6_PAPXU|nr:hypothetical protein RR46_11265 [Papilio xuthus]